MVSAFLVVLRLGVLLVLLGSGIVVRGFGVCSRGLFGVYFVWFVTGVLLVIR